MKLVYLLFFCALALSACSAFESDATTVDKNMSTDRSEVKLEFLTRDGCKNTPVMLERLKTAISTGKIRAEFTLVHQGTLPSEDPRNGYPTPTILMNGQDVFGMPVPQAPFPEPS